MGTRVLFWRSGSKTPLTINADSRYGQVRAQITDHKGKPLSGYTYSDCRPLEDDALAWQPHWGGRTWPSEGLNHTTARVELELLNARVFAIKGDFVPMQGVQVTDFLSTGTPPQTRSGF